MLQYTNINHIARKELGLSWMEYGFADMVYHLSHNPKAPVSGYCSMSRPNMADEMGVSKRTINNYIGRLIDAGLIEKDEATDYLRTTEKWYQTCVSDGGAKISPHAKNSRKGVKKVQDTPAKISPNNNRDKNKEDNLLSSPASKKIERTESGSVDVKSLKTRIAEEAPPVPAAPPNDQPPPPYQPGETPEAYIVRMTDPGPNSMEMDRWKVKHGLTYELILEEIERFADKYLVREFPDMDESQVMQVLTGKNQASFMRIFRSSFLPRIKSNPVTSNHQPHAKSQKQPSSEPPRRKSQRELLADLYPDVAAELYGDLASGVDGRNSEAASHAHWREA